MRRDLLRLVLALTLLLISQAQSLSQSPSQFPSQTQTSSPQASESLLIAGGDLLHISVFDLPELDQRVRVTDAGNVSLALIGQVHIAGLIPSQAALKIAAALAKGEYVRKAQVSVLTEEFAVNNVSVIGQVMHPGNYPLPTQRDLMDVISMAGGLTPTADIRITVKRHGDAGEVVYASLPNNPGDAILQSVKVSPGDLVIVPRAGLVYVLGDVSRPGGYVMQYDAQLTALQAIALASGMTKTSSEKHARLVRQTPRGPTELPLSLSAMQKGITPDLPLRPDDVIYVPYSTAKNVMLGASAILSSASGAAIYTAR